MGYSSNFFGLNGTSVAYRIRALEEAGGYLSLSLLLRLVGGECAAANNVQAISTVGGV